MSVPSPGARIAGRSPFVWNAVKKPKSRSGPFPFPAVKQDSWPTVNQELLHLTGIPRENKLPSLQPNLKQNVKKHWKIKAMILSILMKIWSIKIYTWLIFCLINLMRKRFSLQRILPSGPSYFHKTVKRLHWLQPKKILLTTIICSSMFIYWI